MHQEFIWVRLKLTFARYSLWTNFYFVTESIDAFYFVNHVAVYKALLVWKSKTRVTSCESNPRVTSSNSQVTSSNPRVGRLKAQVAWLKAWVGRLKHELRD